MFYFEALPGSAAAALANEANMVDAALSWREAPRWHFTEDAEETEALGKFNRTGLCSKDDDRLRARTELGSDETDG